MASLVKVLMSTALSMQDLVFAPQLRTAPEGGSTHAYVNMVKS